MGIDPLHRGINDFETPAGVPAAEHDFQNAAETKRGIRTALCRRFAENENSDRTGLLFGRHQERMGFPGRALSIIKLSGEVLIDGVGLAALHLHKKTGGVTITEDAQS